ncbi:MAG: head-tail connector protein [Paeniclostridium sp.]|nr:head-tail connector protein [Paeniclostridium sp.]MBW4863756.1 head-tail connector protein [Paeniclostridium sp.]MBW4874684.1 head-tail connector protein [Paeniclostridium sp.]
MNDEKSKFSTINISHCKKHLNIEEEFTEDDSLIGICLHAAKDYIKNYTSLTVEQLDGIDSIVIATLVLVSDFYSRRSAAFGYDNNRINFVLKSILDMYRKWL